MTARTVPDLAKLVDLVRDCQRDLAEYLPPGSGISEREAIHRLLARLDGPQAREALGEDGPPAEGPPL